MCLECRLFQCPWCGEEVVVCRPCDRGQRYCSEECRVAARRKSWREGSRKYQAREEGRANHRRRQKRYRFRRATQERGGEEKAKGGMERKEGGSGRSSGAAGDVVREPGGAAPRSESCREQGAVVPATSTETPGAKRDSTVFTRSQDGATEGEQRHGAGGAGDGGPAGEPLLWCHFCGRPCKGPPRADFIRRREARAPSAW